MSRNYNFRIINILLLVALVISLSYASEESILINYDYHDKNHTISVHVSYSITAEKYIRIKRTTTEVSSGKQVEDYIILRPIRTSDAHEMYTLVKNSRQFLIQYMDTFVDNYGGSEEDARLMISIDNQQKERMSLGIFYKKNQEYSAIMVGYIGYHSPQAFSNQENSVDIVYWVGNPVYTKAAGIGTVAAHAFIDWLVANGRAGRVVITVDKANQASINVAKKLKMRKASRTHERWPYGYGEQSPENMEIYTLSCIEWERAHWNTNKA
ncbi:MAG: GNAT family protein [Bacteroidota bacterium]